MKKKAKICLHSNIVGIMSNTLSNNNNLVTIKCTNCGAIRYEERNTLSKSVMTSKWFKLNDL